MPINSMVAPVEELDWSADALERLAQLRGAREIIDWHIERAIVECRAVHPPMSWDRIGEALGITRQTAWQRYRHCEES